MRIKAHGLTVLLAVGLTALAGTALAADSDTLSQSDLHFLQEAAHANKAEVAMGQLALQRAVHASVRSFAQKMVDDHSLAQGRLKQLATQQGVNLSYTLGPKNQATYDKLALHTGPAFDRAYMKAMLQDHKMDVREFKKQTRTADGSRVRAWAAQILPTLEDHLKMAQKIYPNLPGVAGGRRARR